MDGERRKQRALAPLRPVHCRALGCETQLDRGAVSSLCVRAKLCPAHLEAPSVELCCGAVLLSMPPCGSDSKQVLDQNVGRFRFCQKCLRMHTLSEFTGTARTCAAAALKLKRKRTEAAAALAATNTTETWATAFDTATTSASAVTAGTDDAADLWDSLGKFLDVETNIGEM